ncbi:protein kinase domain-containing protein [Sorangium sp. So ce131]|uniref:serine/threonine-protein kinase n=1 Tax=Sorangium sp. So ce131 TaxID=3133282 RepID=UPI003F6244D5
MSIAAGQVLSERYRLIRPVGQGAQASVWVAEHLALSTHVAVKLIDPELAKQEEARERFRREATAAAQLRSAHVVQIIDHGIEGEQPFIVMELLEGEDLFERLARRQRLTLQETSKIVTQVARALTRAHGAGIVHRDLKPENFFISANEDEEVVKILDFGIAKVKGQGKRAIQRTTVGTLMGTPHYMSPEQVKGLREVDYRADLWALGVIVYQCVTGQLPFDSEGVGDLLIKISLGEIPVPSRVNPELPPSFDAWFARACDRDPERRFDSARELAESLARIADLSTETSSAVSSPRPPPMPTAPRPAPTRPPPAPPRPATGSAIPKAPPLPRLADPAGADAARPPEPGPAERPAERAAAPLPARPSARPPARPSERPPLPAQRSERPSARPPPSEGAPLSARLGDRPPLPPRPTGAPPSAAPPLPTGAPRPTGAPLSAAPPLPAGSPRPTGVPPSAKPPLPPRAPRGTGVPPSAAPPLPAGAPRPTDTPLSTAAPRSAQPVAVPPAAVDVGLASAPPRANGAELAPGSGSAPSLEIDVEDFEGDLVHDTEEAPAPSALAPEAPATLTLQGSAAPAAAAPATLAPQDSAALASAALASAAPAAAAPATLTPQGSAALAPAAPATFTPQVPSAPAQPALAAPTPLDAAPAAPDAPADPSPAAQAPSAAQPPSMRSPEPPAPALAPDAPPAHAPMEPPRDAAARAPAVDAGIAAAPASLRAGPSRPQVAPAVTSPERALPSSGTPDQWVKSSSVSGMAHEGAHPEFDAGSRRRRLVRWGAFLLIALTGAVVWQVVRSQLPPRDTPTSASASAAPAPAQPEPAPSPPAPTGAASAAPAVDPGQPAASATASAPPKKRRAPPPPKRPRKQQQPKVDDLTLEGSGTPAEPAADEPTPAETSPEPGSAPQEAPTPQPEQ